MNVSIHASRTGRDGHAGKTWAASSCFNPRVPYGTRPKRGYEVMVKVNVSIHASRTGRDGDLMSSILIMKSFNPRVPYGTRLDHHPKADALLLFQSTRPVRDAT